MIATQSAEPPSFSRLTTPIEPYQRRLWADHAGFVKLSDDWPAFGHHQIHTGIADHMTRAVVAISSQTEAWRLGKQGITSLSSDAELAELQGLAHYSREDEHILAIGPTGIICRVTRSMVPPEYKPLWSWPIPHGLVTSGVLIQAHPLKVPMFFQDQSVACRDAHIAAYRTSIGARLRQLEKKDADAANKGARP